MGDYRSHGRRLDEVEKELLALRAFKARAEKLFKLIGRLVRIELELADSKFARRRKKH